MAIGKGSKRKKGGNKKKADPMTKKEWVTLHLCSYKGGVLRPFSGHKGNWTIVNRTQATYKATDALMGSQFEVRADDRGRDMTADEHTAETATPVYFVVKYKVVAVKDDERSCICLPCGVRPTKGYIGEKMRKRHTTIDTCVDFHTSDGYKVRVLIKAITKRQEHMVKRSAYAKASQVQLIRNKIREVTKKECQSRCLADIVDDMVSARSLADAIGNATSLIYPLKSDQLMFWLKVAKYPNTNFKFDMMTVEGNEDVQGILEREQMEEEARLEEGGEEVEEM